MSPDLWIITIGIFSAAACGLIGVFLVLRQNAMLGDAISHSVLPGLVLGFIVTSSRDVIPMVVGAGVMGLLTAFMTEVLFNTRRVYKDAALGIVFTFLFAIGIILVTLYSGQIDLDADCVLYGEIAYTPWDTIIYGGRDLGPRAFWILGAVLLADVLFIGLFYKQLKVTSFDPALADSIGISAKTWHYLLVAMVSLTVVAAFESVGAILVVAMLIIPAATAHMVTHRLPVLLILSVIIGIACAVGGFYAAEYYDASIAGFMAVVGGLIFGLTLVGKVLYHKLSRTESMEDADPGESPVASPN